jgi:hypothetical protein
MFATARMLLPHSIPAAEEAAVLINSNTALTPQEYGLLTIPETALVLQVIDLLKYRDNDMAAVYVQAHPGKQLQHGMLHVSQSVLQLMIFLQTCQLFVQDQMLLQHLILAKEEQAVLTNINTVTTVAETGIHFTRVILSAH